MKCAHCGTDNPPGKIVCRNCGRRLRSAGPAGPSPLTDEELMARVRSDVRRLVIVTAVVLAVGAALGALIR
ncbi:MAG: hypothetical protein QN173_00130 [Armatimonadota bacterium]|nr:hypothetical protein [Armatimonadota bacterium]MDR7400721.1 hypothetical protein [Armatimonadota bacterium]MDR7436468.1 hypothetical protein [Armatimonadota bacterium]MDR7472503.1 hypothetical protein [Armatimonadota bacterium]MDR7506005.1 hypothetical protein [Armatimonadota bacterium]